MMRVLAEASVRCFVRGDVALNEFVPSPEEEHDRSEPLDPTRGPQVRDVIRMFVRGDSQVGTVIRTESLGRRLKYAIRCDDGRLFDDILTVPWTFVQTAPAMAVATSAAVAPRPGAAPSAKALGKTGWAPEEAGRSVVVSSSSTRSLWRPSRGWNPR